LFQHKNETGPKEAVDAVQKLLQCCGEKGPTDYLNIIGTIPKSCCKLTVKTCDSSTAYQTGCTQALADGLTGVTKNLTWAAIGFSIVMVNFNKFVHMYRF
jgi:hypothetical protein